MRTSALFLLHCSVFVPAKSSRCNGNKVYFQMRFKPECINTHGNVWQQSESKATYVTDKYQEARKTAERMKQQVPVRDSGVRKTLTLSVMPHHSILSSIKSHMGMYRKSTISQQIPVRLIICKWFTQLSRTRGDLRTPVFMKKWICAGIFPLMRFHSFFTGETN